MLLFTKTIFSQTQKQDEFGRNYLQYNFDRIQFLIDENYFLTIPSLSQLKLHDSELDSLLKKKRELEALSLVSNLKYCLNSEAKEERQKNFSFYKKWGNIYNSLFAKYKDVVHENPFYIDPKFCLKQIKDEKFYFLNSEDFAFQFQIPVKYKFQRIQDFAFVNEGIYQWKALVFKEKFPEPDLEEYSMQDILDFLSKQKPIPKQRGGKLFVFFLEHKYDRFAPKLMLDFWDRKRGLTSQNLNQFQFQRSFLENESLSQFQVLDSNGEKTEYECKEKVFGKEKRSVGIFFVYPKAQKEIYEKDFQLMKLNIH